MTDMHYHMSQFVGRIDELSTLVRLLQSAEQPTAAPHVPRCLLLEGEAGIGKTRLAEEVHLEAEHRGWAALWVRVYEQEQGVAYSLWTQVLRQLLTQNLWEFSPQSKQSSLFSPLFALLPEHSPHPFEKTLDTLLPGQSLRLWEAVLALLREASKTVPLLLVLDDIHALDVSSIELLGFLARHLPERLLLVGTYRAYEHSLPSAHVLHALVAHLQREMHATVLHLGPLSDAHIQSLLTSMPHVTESTIQKIQVQAAGNPFFAEELARTPSFGPSTTLEATLDARLSLLSLDCRKMLHIASVIGSPITLLFLAQTEKNLSVSNDGEVLLTLIEEALHAQILVEEERDVRSLSYRFSHPLLAHHLYNSISATRRARTHRHIGTLIMEQYQGREYEVADTITHHLVEGGGDASRIVLYAEMAAGRAYRLSAYVLAERYLRIAVEHKKVLLSHHESERDAHLAFLLECLAECRKIQGNDEEARMLYQQVLAIHQQQKNETDSLERVQLQAVIWCEIGQTWYNSGAYVEAADAFEQGDRLLLHDGITTGIAHARIRFEQSYLLWRQGRYDGANTVGKEALAFFRQTLSSRRETSPSSPVGTSIRRSLAGDPVDIGRSFVLLGLIANSRGLPDEAVEYWTSALPVFEQYECVREIANVSCDLADIYLKEAKYPDAQTVLTRALALAERVNDVPLLSVVYGNLGNLAARTGNLLKAEDCLRRAVTLAEQAHEPLYESIVSAYLATVLRDQGAIAEARTSVARALRRSRMLGNLPCQAHVLVTLAGLYLSLATASSDTSSQRTHSHLRRVGQLVALASQLEGVEEETKAEGLLLLAEVMIERDTKSAWLHAHASLDIVQASSLHWLLPRIYTLLARILVAQGQQAQGDSYFRQALDLFHTYPCFVDHVRALYQYGNILLQQCKETDQEYERGVTYLHEAAHLCRQSEAIWDLCVIERALLVVSSSTEKKKGEE